MAKQIKRKISDISRYGIPLNESPTSSGIRGTIDTHEAARDAKVRTKNVKVKNYRGTSTANLKKQLKGRQGSNKALLSTDTVTYKTYDIREVNKKHIKAIKKELSRRSAGGLVEG